MFDVERWIGPRADEAAWDEEIDEDPNAVPDEVRMRFEVAATAWYSALAPESRQHTDVIAAWLEEDEERVTIRVERYHCPSCQGDWENFETFSLPRTALEADDLDEVRELVRAEAHDVRREREERRAHHNAWRQEEKRRAEIVLMRRLMEKYPDYVDADAPLPEIGDDPDPRSANVTALLSYRLTDPQP